MRLLNRTLAVVVALTIAAGGFVVAAEIAIAGAGRGPWVLPYGDWYHSATSNRWDASGPRLCFMAVCLLGLALLALQIVREPPRSLTLRTGRTPAGLSRRSLEGALARAAGAVDGVSAARASVGRNRARLVVATNRRTGDLRAPVEAAVRDRLARFDLATPLDVVVAVNGPGRGKRGSAR